MAMERMFWEVPVYSSRNVTTVATLSPYHLAFPDFPLFWRIRRTRDFCHKILLANLAISVACFLQTWKFSLGMANMATFIEFLRVTAVCQIQLNVFKGFHLQR